MGALRLIRKALSFRMYNPNITVSCGSGRDSGPDTRELRMREIGQMVAGGWGI
jgi:hypothetical protein